MEEVLGSPARVGAAGSPSPWRGSLPCIDCKISSIDKKMETNEQIRSEREKTLHTWDTWRHHEAEDA